MINIKNQVPSVYYNASRDFQVLGHLYEIVLNYSKTNADMLYLLPTGLEADTRSTELLALTLGFKLRRNYDKAQLAALVSIFPRLVKMKGTIQAVNLAGNALIKASGVPGAFESELKNHVLTIKVPQELSDTTLLLDLLPYIIPFGIRVSIIRTTIIKQNLTTSIGTTSIIRKALPGLSIGENGEINKLPVGEHPLGLAKIAMADDTGNNVYVDYSNIGVITTIKDNAEMQEPVVGMMSTSPVITIDPTSTTKEENT